MNNNLFLIIILCLSAFTSCGVDIENCPVLESHLAFFDSWENTINEIISEEGQTNCQLSQDYITSLLLFQDCADALGVGDDIRDRIEEAQAIFDEGSCR